MSNYLSYREAAELLRMPVNTLTALVHRKRIPHVRLGPRSVRFERDALEKWMADQRVEVSDD